MIAKKSVKKSTKSVKSPLCVGNKVLIRGVTLYYTGEIVELNPREILLARAAWIADTDRFATALKTGEMREVEPFPEGAIVSVNRETYVDCVTWTHPLPNAQK